MLKKHAQFFKSLFFISDLLILLLAWIFSYIIRFYTNLFGPPILGTPDLWLYIQFLPILLIVWTLISIKIKLYRPRRIDHFYKEFFDVITCLSFTLIIFISLIYLFRRFEFSRLGFFCFWIMGIFGLISVRICARMTLRILRKRGYNLRFALIAGTGPLSQMILEKIELHPELGIKVIGLLSRKTNEVGKTVKEVPVLGCYENLERIIQERAVDIFFVAISINEYDQFEKLVQKVLGNLPEIRVVPASYEFLGLRGGLDELDGLPIVSLQGSPLFGWNSIFKRIFDLLLGTLIFFVASPMMLLISFLVKLTSEGPVLYRQERVGMDGHPFEMFKFRTMKVGAERETGPVWAKKNDPRRTKVGVFLRKTSLDELPQLFNVLKGEMSLVGPRPERPTFVKEFRNKVPSYMLRHKIKTGMTGWAQVNGWRGNTSLEKRIEHDLHYIQHWSIGFDLKILLMTMWRSISSRSAY